MIQPPALPKWLTEWRDDPEHLLPSLLSEVIDQLRRRQPTFRELVEWAEEWGYDLAEVNDELLCLRNVGIVEQREGRWVLADWYLRCTAAMGANPSNPSVGRVEGAVLIDGEGGRPDRLIRVSSWTGSPDWAAARSGGGPAPLIFSDRFPDGPSKRPVDPENPFNLKPGEALGEVKWVDDGHGCLRGVVPVVPPKAERLKSLFR